MTNSGEKSQEVFELYKFRNDVEESFDVFKKLLQTDTPYMRVMIPCEDIFLFHSFSSLHIIA